MLKRPMGIGDVNADDKEEVDEVISELRVEGEQGDSAGRVAGVAVESCEGSTTL